MNFIKNKDINPETINLVTIISLQPSFSGNAWHLVMATPEGRMRSLIDSTKAKRIIQRGLELSTYHGA